MASVLLITLIISITIAPAGTDPSGVSTYEQIGAACLNDDDCGPNEACKPLPFKPPYCRLGRCECKDWCVPVLQSNTNSSTGRCLPIKRLQICHDDYNGPLYGCNDTCTGAPNERYPENAACRIVPGRISGRVRCSNDDCYRETSDGRCVQAVSKKRGSSCSADCECAANMGCVAKCRCRPGLKWNGHACRPPNYGDPCQTDADCSPPNMICDVNAGRCTCAKGRYAAQSGYLDHHLQQMATRVICVPGEAMIYAKKGDQCTLVSRNSYGVYDVNNAKEDRATTQPRRDVWICRANTFCYACPGEEDFANELPNNGFCRELQGCLEDSHCGTNEECYRPLIDPPCRYGRCSCRRCFGQNSDKICSPVRLLRIGTQCLGTGDEMYPSGAECSSGIVACDLYHKMSETGCVRSGYNFTWYGAVCQRDSDCGEDLVCQTKSDRECDCGADREMWDEARGKCIDRQLGDRCVKNEHCSAIPTVGDYRNLPVCSRLYKVCTYRLHLNLPVSEIDPNKCLRCPEDVAARATHCRETVEKT